MNYLNQLPDGSIVTCYLRGQIGNQLFILAATLRRLWESAVLKIDSDFLSEIEFGARS